MKFINIETVYYNAHTNKHVKSGRVILINLDSIWLIDYPVKGRDDFYQIWFKNASHQDCIRTFDDVIEKINNEVK